VTSVEQRWPGCGISGPTIPQPLKNSLTLGEAAFVLQEGLAVGGKSLKDHLEVVGHAKAIDLIYDLAKEKIRFIEKELFSLCKMVLAGQVSDVHKPAGEWKKEPNSTVGVVDGKQVGFEFASPADVPSLMMSWFDLYHDLDRAWFRGTGTGRCVSMWRCMLVLSGLIHFLTGPGGWKGWLPICP